MGPLPPAPPHAWLPPAAPRPVTPPRGTPPAYGQIGEQREHPIDEAPAEQ